MIRPKVYIAAPFFNSFQLEIVTKIELILEEFKFLYYSPRLHSGSADLSPGDRSRRECWKPVLDSNIDELWQCKLLLAVVEYAMPPDTKLRAVYTGVSQPVVGKAFELPDNGVVFEIGYRKSLNDQCKLETCPIVLFHRTKQPAELNLMLTHTADGIITGWDALRKFFAGKWKYNDTIEDMDRCTLDWDVVQKIGSEVI